MSRPRYVYIAGPYTKGDVSRNVAKAIEVGETLRALGYMPYVPHLSHFWNMLFPVDYENWLKLDLAWLDMCDALYRIPGESKGADIEEEFAVNNGIPVFHSLSDLIRYYGGGA